MNGKPPVIINSSLSPPLPQDKNCEVVSPRVHPYPFLDSRLALITPCSQFIHIRTPESEYLIEMQHIFIGRDDVSRHCYPFFQLAYSVHRLTSFLSHVACPSPKGDVEGDISCSLDPHRLDHMGDISQICRRTQPTRRQSKLYFTFFPGRSHDLFDQIPTVAMSKRS